MTSLLRLTSGRWLAAAASLAFAVGLAGCGAQTVGVGVDPLRAIGDPISNRFIDLPLSSSVLNSAAFTTISGAGNVYTWTTTGAFWAAAQPILAPADGLVIEANANSLLLYHNAQLKTRLVGIQVLGIRVGDFVVTGQAIAQTAPGFAGSSFQFSVLQNDVAVCPYSFFTQAAVSRLVSTFFGVLAFRDGLLCLI